MKQQRVYLNDILKRIEQIRHFTEDGRTKFLESDLIQEAVMRCFEVIGESVKRLDSSLKAKYTHIQWRDYTGFRDVLIHQYDKIQLEVVWDAVENDLDPLKKGVQYLLESMPDTEE